MAASHGVRCLGAATELPLSLDPMLHLATFGPPLAFIDLVRSHSDLGAEDRVVTPNLVGRRARCSLQPRPEEHKTTSFGHA